MDYDINLNFLGNYYLGNYCSDIELDMDFECIDLYYANSDLRKNQPVFWPLYGLHPLD